MGGPILVRVLLVAAMSLIAGLPHLPAIAQGNKNNNQHRRTNSNARARAQQSQQQAMIKAAQQQLAAGKELLAAAESKGSSAKSKLDSALAKMKESSKDFHDAQSTSRKLAKELAEIEQDLIDDQKPESPYGKASEQLDKARPKLREVEERVVSEPAVQSELTGLTGVKLAERTKAVLTVRPEYIEAKTEFDAAASQVEKLRHELYHNDNDWKATSEALAAARKEEREAESKTRGGVGDRRNMPETIRDAEHAADVARAMIRQAEAVLKSTQRNQPGPPNNAKQKGKNN